MRKVALIKGIYDDYENTTLIQSITDWTEVSEEDFQVLNRFTYMLEGWILIEQSTDQNAIIMKTVAQALVIVRKEEESRQKRIADAAAKQEANKAKKAQLKAEKDREHLATLIKHNPDLIKDFLK